MKANKDKGTSVGFSKNTSTFQNLSKSEIEKEGEEIAAALGYNIHSLSLDLINVKTAYCIGRARYGNFTVQDGEPICSETLMLSVMAYADLDFP